MRVWRAAVFAALLTFTPLALRAGMIELHSPDGGLAISGDLLGFDGSYYRVQTSHGEVTIRAEGLRCVGADCPALLGHVPEIHIYGAAGIGEGLLPALIQSYARESNKRVMHAVSADGGIMAYELRDESGQKSLFHIYPGTSDAGIEALIAGKADMAMSLRKITAQEIARARAAGRGDMTSPHRVRLLALDAFVVISAEQNKSLQLSLETIAAILSGQISNWSDLGGTDAPISLHLHQTETALILRHMQASLGEEALQLPLTGHITHRSNRALSLAVAEDPFALGITRVSERAEARALVIGGACGFGLSATRLSIKNEDYPLDAPFLIYLPARRLPEMGRNFLSYLQSPEAQTVIRRAGFVDQTPQEQGLEAQGARLLQAIRVADQAGGLTQLQQMTQDLSAYKRLSMSFRFEPETTRLDAQSEANARRLAQALRDGTYDGRALRFVGFSDGQGTARANLEIAQKRAKTVQGAVMALVGSEELSSVKISTSAYGEALPMACDDSAWEQRINRRVEVWIQ